MSDNYEPPPPSPPPAYFPPPVPGPPAPWLVPQPVALEVQPVPLTAKWDFDGGAATYFGTALLAFLITICTAGFGVPWAICLRYSWRTKHTLVNGYRLKFTGGGGRLFGQWIKWWLLCVITIGIYSFWVVPRLTRWITRHTEFDMAAPRVTR